MSVNSQIGRVVLAIDEESQGRYVYVFPVYTKTFLYLCVK
jgi:hypothetical protein